MKLEFIDEISETDITLDLGLKFKDYVPKTTHSFAKIKWNLVVEAKSWGLEAFNFQLSFLDIPIVVDLFENNKKNGSLKGYSVGEEIDKTRFFQVKCTAGKARLPDSALRASIRELMVLM